MFSTSFRKGINFWVILLAALNDRAFPKWVYSKRKEFSHREQMFFFSVLTLIQKGAKMKR